MVKTKKTITASPTTETTAENQQETAPATPQVVAKENAEENVVYVFNSKKSERVPSLSPECLAVETSLRFKKINYKYASNDKCVDKTHGEPIILLNQKEYVGFDKIEDALTSLTADQPESVIFPELTADQQADCQAFVYALADTVLYQLLHHLRFKHTSTTTTEDIIKRVKSGFQRFFKGTKEEDRLTKLKPEQLVEILKDGTKSLLNYLLRGGADKTYFFGDKPTKHDAILFGILAQFWLEAPTVNGGSTTEFSLKSVSENGDDKIVSYLQNIKDTYWPDWTDRCAKPAPPPTSTPSKRATFRKSKSEQQHAQTVTTTVTTPPENGASAVNGIVNEKVTNGGENGEIKDAEKKEQHENGGDKTSEIKNIDEEQVIVPPTEIKAE